LSRRVSRAKRRMLDDPVLVREIAVVADTCAVCLRRGGKLLSPATVQCRDASTRRGTRRTVQRERRALPAIALTTDTSILTAVANDWGYERAFQRQIEALAHVGDVLVAISTSGNSPSILQAVRSATTVGW